MALPRGLDRRSTDAELGRHLSSEQIDFVPFVRRHWLRERSGKGLRHHHVARAVMLPPHLRRDWFQLQRLHDVVILDRLQACARREFEQIGRNVFEIRQRPGGRLRATATRVPEGAPCRQRHVRIRLLLRTHVLSPHPEMQQRAAGRAVGQDGRKPSSPDFKGRLFVRVAVVAHIHTGGAWRAVEMI